MKVTVRIFAAVFLSLALYGCDKSSDNKDALGAMLNSSKHDVDGKLDKYPINDPFDKPAK